MGLSTALVLLVIFLAYGRFAKKATLDPEADELPFLQRLLARKWYLDELYAYLFEKPYGWLSSVFHSVGEGRIMVPLMNGAGRVTQRAGQVLRLAQTGNMSFYLFAMVAGIVVFLLMTLYGR
jgi:NADH-quinone oxidoreductase subunit L